MGKGRKRKLPHLRVVTETKKEKDSQADGSVEIPEPPRSLSKEGRALWPQVMADLAKWGVTDRVDAHALATYCNVVARMVKAQAFLDEYGETYETVGKSGRMFRQRPELKTVEECESKLARFAAEFGMTPASRTKFGDPRQGKLFEDDPT